MKNHWLTRYDQKQNDVDFFSIKIFFDMTSMEFCDNGNHYFINSNKNVENFEQLFYQTMGDDC